MVSAPFGFWVPGVKGLNWGPPLLFFRVGCVYVAM